MTVGSGSEDLAAYVSRGVASATWRYRARVLVHAPASAIADRVAFAGTVTAIDDNSCQFEAGSDNPESMALWLGMLGADFTILDAPELTEHLRALAGRYRKAIA